MQRMANAIPGADEFRNNFLRGFASALNMSFEELSLDFSRSNYSSTRASMISAWRNVTFERAMFCNHVAKPIYKAVIEEAFEIGLVRPPAGAPDFYDAIAAYTACTWTGPGMGWVDPLKEANAASVRKGAAISTLEAENAAQGNNWRDTLDQQAIEREYAAELGVPYDEVEAAAAAAGNDADAEDDAEDRQAEG